MKPEEVNGGMLYQSSSLAVALEFLGKLSNWEKEYSKTRGGIAFDYTDDNGERNFLTTRELLELLPD
jgi:hypothetical protein